MDRGLFEGEGHDDLRRAAGNLAGIVQRVARRRDDGLRELGGQVLTLAANHGHGRGFRQVGQRARLGDGDAEIAQFVDQTLS